MRLVLCDDNLLLGEALAPALTASGHQIAAITTSLAGGWPRSARTDRTRA